MIRNTSAQGILLSPQSAFIQSGKIVDGSVVSVTIQGKTASGDTLVRIAGLTFTASSMIETGNLSRFDARITFVSGTLYIQPLLPDNPSASIFSRLGIPETEISHFVVSFLQRINVRLDEKNIASLIRIAGRFPGKEKKAAEAASILFERGIEPSFESVERLLACIDGDRGNSDSHEPDDSADRDFVSFINQKKGHSRHWIVIPFRKDIAGKLLIGSVRFLLDTETKTCLGTRITCRDGSRCWEFELSGSECNFTSEPPFKSVVFERFVVYLKSILAVQNISEVSWYLSGTNPAPVFETVDVRI